MLATDLSLRQQLILADLRRRFATGEWFRLAETYSGRTPAGVRRRLVVFGLAKAGVLRRWDRNGYEYYQLREEPTE